MVFANRIYYFNTRPIVNYCIQVADCGKKDANSLIGTSVYIIPRSESKGQSTIPWVLSEGLACRRRDKVCLHAVRGEMRRIAGKAQPGYFLKDKLEYMLIFCTIP